MSKRRSGLHNQRRAYDCACGVSYPTFEIELENGTGSPQTYNLTEIPIPGSILDLRRPNFNVLDDGNVLIPMEDNSIFNFFGTNYSNNIYWSSNNALIFGTSRDPHFEINITRDLVPAILLGNYDRMLKYFQYSNSSTPKYAITTILVTFYDYFSDAESALNYQYKIRLIKERVNQQRQFVEVYVLSSPPSPGYSTSITNYPSGPNDSIGNDIDPTKYSPYNITDGNQFLNPCGSTFGLSSPPANTSFVFSSDSDGTNWVFTDNSYVAV